MGKCTYGTGAFALVNTGSTPVTTERLLTTVAWRIGGRTTYALEGSVFIAGAAVQWLRDGLQLFKRASEIEKLARSVPDSGEVIVVPAFTGLGAPHWRPEARGVITGITRGTTAAHIARATLEGIALQVYDLFASMSKDYGRSLATLRVDGGAAANNLLMQFQTDLLGTEIHRPKVVETTALGAGFGRPRVGDFLRRRGRGEGVEARAGLSSHHGACPSRRNSPTLARGRAEGVTAPTAHGAPQIHRRCRQHRLAAPRASPDASRRGELPRSARSGFAAAAWLRRSRIRLAWRGAVEP